MPALQPLSDLARLCLSSDIKLLTPESCLGGIVRAVIIHIAGSFQWFDAGFVTYRNDVKMAMLKGKKAS